MASLVILRKWLTLQSLKRICARMSTNTEATEGNMNLEEQMKEWERTQNDLRSKIIMRDTLEWQISRHAVDSDQEETDSEKMVHYVAGMDISYLKNKSDACVALIICQLPSLRVVYKDFEMVEWKSPYVPGFLSFREADPLIHIYNKLKMMQVKFMPQVLLIDGNGALHSRGCGLACHVGFMLDVPTIGVAKNLFHIDGLVKDKEKDQTLACKGDTYPLIGDSGHTLGVALKTCNMAEKPVYVSVGHKISLETAAWLTSKCSLHRIPEPIRQADILSREFLRKKFPEQFP